VLQFATLALVIGARYAGVGWPGAFSGGAAVAGVILAGVGLVLAVAGGRTLGRSLTPLPKPRAGATLRRGGVYRLVRHPIYGGVILMAAGWSLGSAPLGLVPTAALVGVFTFKARREETWLLAHYADYAEYRARTPRRLLPWLL